MENCYDYRLNWRYEFNHTKSGVVTFGEDKQTHKSKRNEREWKLGSKKVGELHEYKNLGVAKNCFGSSALDIDIEKTRKKRE